MNKKMLLAGAAVLALTISSAANADPVQLNTTAVTISPTVDLVGSFDLVKGNELKFGVIMNPTSGQSVTVTKEGQVYGDATLLGQAIGADEAGKISATSQTVSAGSFEVKGNIATLIGRSDIASVTIDMPNEGADTNGLILTADGADNGTVCGKITGLTDINVTAAGNYYYGGTFTIDAGIDGTSDTFAGMHCLPKGGPRTVTLIMTEATPVNP